MTAADLIDTTLLGRYRVVKKLGQGGMGAVYEARHEKLGKRVAIKVLLDRHASNTDIAQRFEQEARLASAIGDSHIIDVADIGQTDDGRTCIVMELLDGASLAQLLVREPDISETRIAGLVAQAARALAAAHAKGIIHRDIKPENLFVLDRDGDFVKVVDFGISKLVGGDAGDPKLTGTGMVIGTAAYMSPEQARGDDIDERVDVYALGVVMYEAATGRLPFTGDNYLKVLGQIVSDEPKPLRALRPAISERFERICLKAMAKRREDRYASASELAAALDSLRTGAETAPTVAMPAATSIATEPTMASPSPAVPVAAPSGSPRRISPRSLGAIALVAAVAIIAILAIARRGGGSSTTLDDRIEVAIETDPQGAAILQGDKVLGYTPMKYRFLLENKVIELSAQMPGYDIACFVVNPAEEKLEDKQLVKIRMPDAGTTQNCLLKR